MKNRSAHAENKETLSPAFDEAAFAAEHKGRGEITLTIRSLMKGGSYERLRISSRNGRESCKGVDQVTKESIPVYEIQHSLEARLMEKSNGPF